MKVTKFTTTVLALAMVALVGCGGGGGSSKNTTDATQTDQNNGGQNQGGGNNQGSGDDNNQGSDNGNNQGNGDGNNQGNGDGNNQGNGDNQGNEDNNNQGSGSNVTPPPPTQGLNSSGIIINHKTDTIGSIPAEWINKAKQDLHIVYQGTSHSRQLSKGMEAFETQSNIKGRKGDIYGVDLSGNGASGKLDMKENFEGWWSNLAGSKNFDEATRDYLDSHPKVNVVFWMWCYQRADWNNADDPVSKQVDIDNYLAKMEQLISEYGEGGSKVTASRKPVTFVFATGPNTGNTPRFAENENKIVYDYNQKIRQHAIKNNRVLYDFYDIESYDPDGNYYGDGDGSQSNVYAKYTGKNNLDENHYGSFSTLNEYENRPNWATTWQYNHTEGVDYFKFDSTVEHTGGIEHTNAVDANAKVYAMWWLFARLAGWDGK